MAVERPPGAIRVMLGIKTQHHSCDFAPISTFRIRVEQAQIRDDMLPRRRWSIRNRKVRYRRHRDQAAASAWAFLATGRRRPSLRWVLGRLMTVSGDKKPPSEAAYCLCEGHVRSPHRHSYIRILLPLAESSMAPINCGSSPHLLQRSGSTFGAASTM